MSENSKKFDVGEIYHFQEYYFTDGEDGEIKSRHAIVLIPKDTTSFVAQVMSTEVSGQAYFMPIIKKNLCRSGDICHMLTKNNYNFLDQDRFCCPCKHDMHGTDSSNIKFVDCIIDEDIRPLFKKIKSAFFCGQLPEYMSKPYVRGAILQEWSALRDERLGKSV